MKSFAGRGKGWLVVQIRIICFTLFLCSTLSIMSKSYHQKVQPVPSKVLDGGIPMFGWLHPKDPQTTLDLDPQMCWWNQHRVATDPPPYWWDVHFPSFNHFSLLLKTWCVFCIWKKHAIFLALFSINGWVESSSSSSSSPPPPASSSSSSSSSSTVAHAEHPTSPSVSCSFDCFHSERSLVVNPQHVCSQRPYATASPSPKTDWMICPCFPMCENHPKGLCHGLDSFFQMFSHSWMIPSSTPSSLCFTQLRWSCRAVTRARWSSSRGARPWDLGDLYGEDLGLSMAMVMVISWVITHGDSCELSIVNNVDSWLI